MSIDKESYGPSSGLMKQIPGKEIGPSAAHQTSKLGALDTASHSSKFLKQTLGEGPLAQPRHMVSANEPAPSHQKARLVDFALQREYLRILTELGNDEDLLVEVILSDGRVVLVSSFGYSTEDMLTVVGVIGDRDVSVFLHFSTVQVIFTKIKVSPPAIRRPIGFQFIGQ